MIRLSLALLPQHSDIRQTWSSVTSECCFTALAFFPLHFNYCFKYKQVKNTLIFNIQYIKQILISYVVAEIFHWLFLPDIYERVTESLIQTVHLKYWFIQERKNPLKVKHSFKNTDSRMRKYIFHCWTKNVLLRDVWRSIMLLLCVEFLLVEQKYCNWQHCV